MSRRLTPLSSLLWWLAKRLRRCCRWALGLPDVVARGKNKKDGGKCFAIITSGHALQSCGTLSAFVVQQAAHGVERVAVVDIDVHHGNGTQALFEEDPTTFYASTHQVGACCVRLCCRR